MFEERHDIDEVLGITRCVQCGHRLDGDVECPFCAAFEGPVTANGKPGMPKWVYFTACFLTSPLSIYFVFTNNRLKLYEKVLAASGCLLWMGLYMWL
ncbi:MAG: hypothetical protein M0Z52_02290 [Actinomycetota bacterium]|nr:hypothetical protein [Actinomycetota bacterium]